VASSSAAQWRDGGAVIRAEGGGWLAAKEAAAAFLGSAAWAE
jgi:hypothetical protein